MHRSNARSTDDTSSANLKANPLTFLNGVKSLQDKHLTFTTSLSDDEDDALPNIYPHSKPMPFIDPSDLACRSFLHADDD